MVLARKKCSVAFGLHHGNMLCGVDKNKNLMVRVGPLQYDKLLSLAHVREMDLTGKALKVLIYVSSEGYDTKSKLSKWIQYGLNFTSSLPKKISK